MGHRAYAHPSPEDVGLERRVVGDVHPTAARVGGRCAGAIAQVVSTHASSDPRPAEEVDAAARETQQGPIVPSSPASMAALSAATSSSAPTVTRYSKGSPTRGATEVLA